MESASAREEKQQIAYFRAPARNRERTAFCIAKIILHDMHHITRRLARLTKSLDQDGLK
jgi:hypothetical protein